MKTLRIVIATLIVAVLALFAFAWSGLYPIGADDHHTKPVYALLELLRERSVGAHSVGIQVPELEGNAMVRAGAGEYEEMCAQCHMRPGQTENELTAGLYPHPPNLTVPDQDEDEDEAMGPAQEFWIIKHGIKASAMPAWGLTHDDGRLWTIVAFLQELPKLNPAEYDALVSSAGMEESEHGAEHHHGNTPDTDAGSEDAPDGDTQSGADSH